MVNKAEAAQIEMQELLVKEQQEEQLLRDITGVQARQLKLQLAMIGQLDPSDLLSATA